jgi:hypothetical protein
MSSGSSIAWREQKHLGTGGREELIAKGLFSGSAKDQSFIYSRPIISRSNLHNNA